MPQPDRSALQARNRLLFMFVVLCILDVALVIVAKDRWAIGRILLTILVMYFVLQGRKWAKYLLMGILSLLVVALIAMVVALNSKLSAFLIVGSWIMVVLCAITTVYMATNKDLNRYFSCRRQAYSQ
ncbi:hypothetical protein WA1_04815 [Scytonema hofmannii PCC 7110]|uniref:Uncharacterized protein n=1 Tax=Scytonema hofmannii PCC 7110 TaxID=128403 RepID=A0A139X024_9CYAN|nr:hypothetical protein [Scytonema hofmannii]KYC37972.1 hypothetical protein WA1_04815 [Scytonema hofmannii PCC 7110]